MDTRSDYIRRSRKGSRLNKRLAVTGVLGVVACASLFAYELGGIAPAEAPRQARAVADATAPAPAMLRTAAPAAAAPAPARRIYPYSIVPGGVHDSQELARVIAADQVVAAHYAGFDAAAFTVKTVDKPRAVYVSYRKGDKVYWTAKKLQLVKGETLLSDGTNDIRTRCGNRISDVPMLPVEAKGPTAEELDAFVDQAASDEDGGTQQVNAESDENPAGEGYRLQTFANGGIVEPAGGTQDRSRYAPRWNGPDSFAGGGSGGLPLFLTNNVEQNVPATGNGGSGSGSGADTGAGTGGDNGTPGKTETSADIPAPVDTSGPKPSDTPPPSGQPGTPNQPDTDPGTKPSIPDTLTPPTTNTPGKPTAPGKAPAKPTDVPEPGTLWLGVVGVVALVAARRRKKPS